MDNRVRDNNQLKAFELDWENPPVLGDLQQDYNNAKGDADTHRGLINEWLNIRNIEGKHKIKPKKKRSSITPKMVRKQNEWRYAALTEPFLISDDLITATPVSHEDVAVARQASMVLNNQFTTKIARVAFFDEYIRTCVDEGTALIRVGWEHKAEEKPVEVPVADPMRALAMQQAGLPPVTTRLQEVSTVNKPTIEIVPYTNFTIDPTCKGDLDNASFVVVSFDTSLSELEDSGINYRNLDILKELGIDESGSDGDHNSEIEEGGFTFSDTPRQKLVAYEYWGYWDIDGSGIVSPIVATWVNNTLIRLEENPFPDKELPFVLVQYMPVRNSCYGEPDAELIQDNQAINGAVMRGIIDIMARSANGQTGVKKGALDFANSRRRDRGEDYEFNAETSPDQVFHMEKFQEVPQSALTMLQLQHQEAESITGIKAFSSGISGNALGEQGVGIKSALDATSKREVAIQRRLAAGIIEVARKFLSMSAVWLSEEEVTRVTNEAFVPIDRDNLNRDIDISLKISTPEADNEKAQELAFMLQTTGPNSDPGEVRIIRAEIARLRNMPALAKRIESYEPPPPSPEQQKNTELELRKKEAEIIKLEAEAMEAKAKAEELMAKVQTELAKAKDYTNSADLKNLDFIEKESGVTQARELEKEHLKVEGQKELREMDLRKQSNKG